MSLAEVHRLGRNHDPDGLIRKDHSTFLSAAAKAASTAAPPPINVTVDYKSQVTIQGDPIPGQAEKFAALLRENAQVVADLVNRAVAEKARVSFK